MEEPTKVCIYARVSTSQQDYTHQLTSLRAYAKEHHYQVVKEYTEKISGAKKVAEREALKELLEDVEQNQVKKILVFECSRLSRRALDFLSIIEKLNERFNIREIAYDRWGAVQMVQNLEGMGFTVVPFGQGFKDMNPPTKELMKLTLEKRIAHGGHPVLRWMMDNIFIKTDPAGNIKPDKEKSTEKIDGVVATIMALDRAIRCGLDNGESVYDGINSFGRHHDLNPNRDILDNEFHISFWIWASDKYIEKHPGIICL